MPKIQIPETVTILDLEDKPLKDQNGKESVLDFTRGFVIRCLLMDPSFGADSASAYAGAEIRGLFKDKKPGDIVELSNDQYARLAKSAEKPQNTYNPLIITQITSYLDAVLKPLEK